MNMEFMWNILHLNWKLKSRFNSTEEIVNEKERIKKIQFLLWNGKFSVSCLTDLSAIESIRISFIFTVFPFKTFCCETLTLGFSWIHFSNKLKFMTKTFVLFLNYDHSKQSHEVFSQWKTDFSCVKFSFKFEWFTQF